MNAELFKELAGTIIYLLPLLALVWKSARLTTRFEALEKNVQEKTKKFCEDHQKLQQEIDEERKSNDNKIDTVMLTLTEIQKSIVRIETKLDIEEGK